MHTIKWKGVFPALLTPFTEEDKIDFNMFGKNLERQIEAGVNGLIICGSLGEASTLTRDEKMELLIFCKEAARGRVPVVLNIAEQNTSEAVSIVTAAEKNGADGLMFLPPMRYKADDRETVAYFTRLAQSTDLPVMIYNNPIDYKIDVSRHMFEKLLKLENIQAVKESTRDVTNITRLKNQFGSRLKILCGVDTLALEAFASGADGWVAGLVDAFPDETVAIYRLMSAGRVADAVQIYRWFMPLLELDILPKLVQYIKLAAVQTGMSNEYVRAPRLQLEDSERQEVLDIINAAISTRPSLHDYTAAQAVKKAVNA